jgi:hypothetical protein
LALLYRRESLVLTKSLLATLHVDDGKERIPTTDSRGFEMTDTSSAATAAPKGLIFRVLDQVERVGN